MDIKFKDRSLDLNRGFSIDIEDTSPIFNDEGSQSVSTTVPPTPANLRVFGWPGRLDTIIDPNNPRVKALLADGAYRRSGMVNVTGISAEEGISFSIGFDDSTAYEAWMDRKLRDLSGLPVVKTTPEALIRRLTGLYEYCHSINEDMAIFPVALSRAEKDPDSVSAKTYWEMINVPNSHGGMEQPAKVWRLINDTPTEVSVPRGYGLSPFLKVWRVIDLIFADLGFRVVSNPFRQSVELRRLVVLNNVADTICAGTLDYSELMPDCTVEEFMNALWVRFGLTFHIDSEEGCVYLYLLDDILQEPAEWVVDNYRSSERIDITFDTPQYIAMRAGTSLDGAAPACERFEDYIKGLSLLDLKVGESITLWKPSSSGKGWDGEFADGPEVEPEYPDDRDPADIPDPWDDYDRDLWEDDRDDDRERVAPATRSGTQGVTVNSRQTWLGRETVTGRWWKLDLVNGLKKDSSSGFFEWNPAPSDLDAMELSSVDECVPVEKISIGSTGTTNNFSGYAPAFLTGARHFHSYIKGNDSENDKDGDTTPLAFMFAYNIDEKTIGRNAPENIDGKALDIDDGGDPGPTLYFQFADGLFANYWSRYDEILRHGARTVEIDIRMAKSEYQGINILKPVLFKGSRCLIDKVEYSLPSGPWLKMRLTLRTIDTLGKYDIEAEQNIPAVAMTAVGLGWVLCDYDWQTAEDEAKPAMEKTALMRFQQLLSDQVVYGEGVDICVDAVGITATSDWIEDIPKTLPANVPTALAGTRKIVKLRGRVYFYCRMVKKVFDPETGVTISKEPIGDVVAHTFVDYTFDAVYVSAYVVKR